MADVPSATSPDGLRIRKKRATRRALHEAALRLALERGTEHVTVEEISAAANVSARTFFNYFQNKEQAMIGEFIVFNPDQMISIIKSSGTVLDGLREVALDVAGNTESEREQVLMRWELVERNPALLPHMMGRIMEFERVLIDALAVRTGHRADDPYPQVGAALAGTALRVSVKRWTYGHGGHPLEHHVNEFFSLLGSALPETGQRAEGETI
jgi:AcrR family transcriptional regulator